jgi:hypothetical protein
VGAFRLRAELKNLSEKIFCFVQAETCIEQLRMPNKTKSPSQPIYPRIASTQSKLVPGSQKISLDAQADEIRKAWLQKPPVRAR